MDEKRAREILKHSIQEDGNLYDLGRYISYIAEQSWVILDGDDFTAEELEAVAWWMKYSKKNVNPEW